MVKKKKEEKIVKIKKAEKVDMGKLILDCIQNKTMELHDMFPELIELRYEKNPDRLVMELSKNVNGIVVTHEGVELPIEIKTKAENKPVIMIDKEDGTGPKPESEELLEQDAVYHKEFGKQALNIMNMSESIGPHTVVENPNAKKKKAIAEWKKRHSNVNIKVDPEEK